MSGSRWSPLVSREDNLESMIEDVNRQIVEILVDRRRRRCSTKTNNNNVRNNNNNNYYYYGGRPLCKFCACERFFSNEKGGDEDVLLMKQLQRENDAMLEDLRETKKEIERCRARLQARLLSESSVITSSVSP
eukprot:PhM_4_TR1935/c0_g1_i1/m.36123